MISRFLLVKGGCPICRESVRAISKINSRLPKEQEIQIIDCYEWEEYGLRRIPLMDKLEKEGFEGYPFLYVDGIVIEPAPTPEQLIKLLEAFLNEEFLY